MNYCVQNSLNFTQYYCDINNKLYNTYQDCFNNCYFQINDAKIHLSYVDMTFLFSMLALILVYAFAHMLFSSDN